MSTVLTSRKTRLSGVAFRAFLAITGSEHWALRRSDQRALLGAVPASTFERRVHAMRPQLSGDELERASHVIGIYKALNILFPGANYADRWIKEPNDAFGGASALDRMLSGFTGLVDVRRYLDAERGW